MKLPGVVLLGMVCSVAAIESIAALPPKYLEVEGFQQCLTVKEVGSYSVWCMPEEKPDSCSVESWKKLLELSGNDQLPECRSAATPVTPSPEKQ